MGAGSIPRENAVTPPAELPDEDLRLIDAARSGQVRAFELLLGRHEGRILRLLRLLGIPAGEREDVAQEVFLRVFRHLDRFQRGRSFVAWTSKIAVNAAHDHRSRTSQRRASEAAYAEQATEVGVPGDDLRLRLERALGELSERERAVFVLTQIDGLEPREVARALGITSITVRRHLSRARSHLASLLEGSG